MAQICRVFINPDNTIRVVRANENIRLPKESDKAFYERVFAMTIEGDVSLQGLEFYDMPVENLPARNEPCDDVDCTDEHSVRNQWRANKAGKKIIRDTSLPHVYKQLDHLVRERDIEDDKPEPDPLKLIVLESKIRRHVKEARKQSGA